MDIAIIILVFWVIPCGLIAIGLKLRDQWKIGKELDQDMDLD